MHFILGAKPGDHPFLFDYVKNSELTKLYDYTDEEGRIFQFRFLNNIPLNASNLDCKVNFLECWETIPATTDDANDKVQRFSWVTDFNLTEDTVYKIMRGGRARWKVENETFNTLKNQGYNLEHNFGHGKNNLATNIVLLILLTFMIDQIQSLACLKYKMVIKKCSGKKRFWRIMSSLFVVLNVSSWENMYHSLILGYEKPDLVPNTS
jgi:hypothetical protein